MLFFMNLGLGSPTLTIENLLLSWRDLVTNFKWLISYITPKITYNTKQQERNIP